VEPHTSEVRVGAIVIYRSAAGVDAPAIVTALTDSPGFIHLHPFMPPGVAPDILSYEWGIERADSENPAPRTWRPRL
jgi:hypothetical protein